LAQPSSGLKGPRGVCIHESPFAKNAFLLVEKAVDELKAEVCDSHLVSVRIDKAYADVSGLPG
jgi:hypothetical protein